MESSLSNNKTFTRFLSYSKDMKHISKDPLESLSYSKDMTHISKDPLESITRDY